VVVLFCLVVVMEGLFTARYKKSPQLNEFPPYTYVQILDHFDPQENRTFIQRYYVNDKYFSGTDEAPVFLYINGEGPVSSPPYADDDFVVILAKKFGAIIVTLEHRYYGKSVPFSSLETPNLKWLNTRQALADLSRFVNDFKNQRGLENHKVFTIGCSYSGALSAWFRLKFPNVTVGSLSSSGVVNAILEFTAFDEQVATSVGPQCAFLLRTTTHEIERLVLHSDPRIAQETKDKFNASMLTVNGDFFYMMGDIMAESVQYDRQDELCDPLINAYQNHGVQGLVPTFINYTVSYWYNIFGHAYHYSTEFQKNTSVAEENADRQWWWQTCTELGYFQIAPKTGSIRSHIVNLEYHRHHCRDVFGVPVWPDTNATNAYYGGNHPNGNKIFFANGSQDPWKHASVTKTLSTSEPAKVIQCHNCGHCVDVRSCAGGCIPNDDAVTQGRTEISDYVAQWLL